MTQSGHSNERIQRDAYCRHRHRETRLRFGDWFLFEGQAEAHMKTARIMVTAVLMAAIGLVLNGAHAQQAGAKRTDLQRHDLSVPGREAIQVRVDIGPGEVAPRHRHPGEEIIYVLEGSLEYEVEGKPPVTLKAGDVLFIPYGTIHSAKNIGSVNAAELATYVVEKGKPLVELIK
jgi:quercetin dioxygenase-like cupin family protein